MQPLSAGPWTALLVGDELARLCYGGRPVLRAVKAVVRNQDWRTPRPSVSNVEVTQAADGLHVQWTVRYSGFGVEYIGLLAARFTPATVEVAFEGTAANSFQSNRIGLVVLHPPADAGRDVTVEHSDGSITASQFPREISPHQPFVDISALEWADAGTAFRLEFTGDVFETEDQRNWTDASFKTYSTPLERPIPVDVAEGDAVRQSIFLEAASFEPQEAVEAAAGLALPGFGTSQQVRARFGNVAGHVPALAMRAGANPGVLPEIPGLDALVVELADVPGEASRSGWAAQLQAVAAAAAVHGAGIDIRATTANPVTAVADLASFLPRAKRLAIFDSGTELTEPGSWQEVKDAARAAGFRGSLLAGSRSHFTELNRSSRRLPSDSDGLTFSITPQVHSTETAHIIDNVPMQRLVAESALRLGSGRPVHVGPVTLLPRRNAVTTPGEAAEPEADELQHLPFTAAWLLASISALTVDGVASVSYFDASGPTGICDDAGRVDPAGELLRELAAVRGSEVLSVDVGAAVPGRSSPVTLYPVQSSVALLVFAANLSGTAVDIDFQLPAGISAALVECKAFGREAGSNVDFAATDGVGPAEGKLTLGPWSARVVRFPAPS
ncbi:hypothetical protein [Pseudarthrobacter sp. DSP2-3-2b1]|uniref:hypothetical protein n=1 Tax=Pseudarthrobacter sp. DSP2-3-2b1 TaxID=2804661 RepID=UPI003CF860DD